MEKITNEKIVNEAISECSYKSVLNALEVPIFLMHYKKGESIVTPFEDNGYFQIISSGSFSIYAIRNDGSQYGLSSGAKDYILGEMDLFVSNDNSIFVTAETDLTAITIDSRKYRENLLSNNAFLRLISEVMARKMEAITNSDVSPTSLPERVLNFIRYKCADNTLTGVEKAASFLHCSSRQLQRILNDLEAEGQIEKIGKGSYRSHS